MQILDSGERAFAVSISGLIYCNPFLAERIEWERAALGDAYLTADEPWNVHPDRAQANLPALMERSETLLAAVATRLDAGDRLAARDRDLYEDVALFVLYHRFLPRFRDVLQRAEPAPSAGRRRVPFFREFVSEAKRLFSSRGLEHRSREDLAHLFACFFQIRRAFDQIFGCIIGVSEPAIRLRAHVWQSIFTHDMRRYRRLLYDRMNDVTTLVTGPSGTGKELVARAIGLSRYVPFDPKGESFTNDYLGAFYPVNLSALSPTLIESELFGHRKGAFTGATADHAGWLEECPAAGTVFLDEIGDLDPAIQLKCLRVLQDRTFQRVGDTTPMIFEGKIIAATNRELAEPMRTGRFREDLYYRLCSDTVTTPSLHERVASDPGELRHLVAHAARQLVGDEGATLAGEVEKWIDRHLGRDYPWPGNVRELEQCIRNVLVRGEYHPPRTGPGASSDRREALANDVRDGRLSAGELLRDYCALVHAQTGSYLEAARRLGLDRRTVKNRVEEHRREHGSAAV
ncbi:MAG: sigma-54-dependent Fis family transcriptional regulator [Planctomycetes bacterium]|nr:sigma-54-dependent Fis family transcriptional regulator [Planctomycetota bacterium]